MSIINICIENYKSIKWCALTMKEINLLIGENGSGKTNVISAIKYFYDNMVGVNEDQHIFDANNKFNNCIKISITYDFSNMKKISYRQLNDGESQYKSFYAKITRMAPDDQLTLTLTKIRDRKVSWNYNLSDRKMILNLFPLYIIDSRNIKLTDWSNLWEQIGDLVKLEDSLSQELKSEFNTIVSNDKYKLEKTFSNLSKAFLKSNLKIKEFSPKQFASSLSKTYFNGSEFEFRENKLTFFSNGTNSFNYFSILIEILVLVADKKMKSPIVLIDEPEISLHHKLIDELTNKLFTCCKMIRFIVSTHSPRLLKNVLKNDKENSSIYHIRLQNHYSNVSKIKLFDTEGDLRPKIFITDQHANAYFAKLILSVEGESELELFGNRYLQEVFPILKEIDMVTGMSDNVVANIISPLKRRYKTPIISVVDMDKIICKNENANKMNIKQMHFSNSRNEKYYYTERRKSTLLVRKRIAAIAEKCRFTYKLPFFSCDDSNYIEFIGLIKQYFKEYSIFVASTTIEGILINQNNYYLFWDFAKSMSNMAKWVDIETLYNRYFKLEKLNLLRLLYSGKSDYILKLEEIKRYNPNIDKFILSAIENNKRSKKTDGWMSKWIEYYFCSLIEISPLKNESYEEFSNKISDKTLNDKVTSRFKADFKELYDLIEMIKSSYI